MSQSVWAAIAIGAAVLMLLAVLFAPLVSAGLAALALIALAVYYNRRKK